MKSSQSNFNLRSPSSFLDRSYLITTVTLENLFTFEMTLKLFFSFIELQRTQGKKTLLEEKKSEKSAIANLSRGHSGHQVLVKVI